ncbi:sentrin-specific protease 2, putative (SENP2) [Babesia microti strain RI]|uniref:Sentrin-specific protease 2, putative (SENP2) n=1 Tax=Babesia microti (strain RI) TaxID=1133968 RepID=A0A1N6LWV2_BABMR|nr:sentrin-specific protease 2, putative (SENP2) [Babesia microti strain RI]SIO73347.1 sentrin-specific protease 2, putative (SENP2) [Babesia microti strain RI]|eukprot:XP_021337449.1 sentrin-specific protease 2, putative (SENP2) [Babesia microti strain RI]
MSNDCFAKFNFSLSAHMPKSLSNLGMGDKDDRELFKVEDIPVFELEHRPQFVYTPIKKESAYYTSSSRSNIEPASGLETGKPEIRVKREVLDDDIIHVSDSESESELAKVTEHRMQEVGKNEEKIEDKVIEIVLSDSDSDAAQPTSSDSSPFIFYKIRCVAALSSSRSIFVDTPICLIFDTQKRKFSFRWVQNVANNREFIGKSIDDIVGNMDLTTTMWTSIDIVKIAMELKRENSRPLYIRFSQNTVLNLRNGDYFSSDGLLFLAIHDTDEIFDQIRTMSKNVKLVDESMGAEIQDRQLKWVLSLCRGRTFKDYGEIKNNVLRAFFLLSAKEGSFYQFRGKPPVICPSVKAVPGWIINNTYLDDCCLARFEPTSYLDDSIIDFFVQFIYNYVMCERQRHDWHIMNCFFLKKLSQYKSTKEAYNDTRRWLKNAKRPMPYKKYIFVPVNLHGTHWSLAIVCHPYKAIRHLQQAHAMIDSDKEACGGPAAPVACFDFEGAEIPSPDGPTYLCPDTISDLTSEYDIQCSKRHKSWCYNYFRHKTFENDLPGDCISVNSDDEPYHAVHKQHTHQLKKIEKAAMIYLDSLEGSYLNSKTLMQLRDHLYYEFQSRRKEFAMDQFDFCRSKHFWQYTHIVDIPKQQNGYDCGIFLLEYIIYLALNPQVIELQLLSPSQDISTRLKLVPCCKVCRGYFSSLLEKKLQPAPAMKGCTCIDIAKRTWFTQEYISQRRNTLIEMLNYMKKNPSWASDDECIEFLVGKLTSNYVSS